MNKYLVIAFAFMGVWFYEASGGADFVPGENTLVVFAEPNPVVPKPAPQVDLVARADTGSQLTEIVPTRATAQPEADAIAGLTLVTLQAPTSPPEEDTVVAEPVIEAPIRDLRFVDGDRVNMRGGPGTSFEVVGKLVRDDMVEVLEDTGDGWLQLRDTATGKEGWMADWLVTASN